MYSKEMDEIIVCLPKEKQKYLIKFLETTRKLLAFIDKASTNLVELETEDLPDHIKDVKDDIINQIIECANASSKISKGNLDGQASQCTEVFKTIQSELDFYRKINLSLLRLCPNCRHYQRLKQKNPLKLWKRKCQCAGAQSDSGIYKNTISHTHGDNHCPNEFQTTYSLERPEIVYCEDCYKTEVV